MIAFWPHQQLHMIVDLTCKQEQEGQKDGKKVWLLVCMNTGTERVVMLIQAGRRPTAEMKSLNQEISKSKNHWIKKQHSKTWCESGTTTQKVGGEGFLTIAGLSGRTMSFKKDLKIWTEHEFTKLRWSRGVGLGRPWPRAISMVAANLPWLQSNITQTTAKAPFHPD